jgi:hypothetical protein
MRIYLHNDVIETINISEESDEEFFDFMDQLMDAYEDGNWIDWIEHFVDEQVAAETPAQGQLP